MALRLRLKFQKGLLTDSQRSDGLNRSWFLLTSHHETISDVVSHLLHTFDLCDTCPDGLLLSLDGYLLPSFETTRILRDKDLICVKRKGVKLVDVIREYRQERAVLEHNVEKKQLENPGVQLLLSEELGKETGGYESENEEDEDKKKQLVLHEEVVPNVDVPVKKRKASKDIKSPKRKRQRQVLQENDEQEAQKEHDGAFLLNGDISKKSSKNKKEHIPEFAGEDLGSVKHKANAKRKRQRQILHESDEQEPQKEHDGACLLNGDLSSKKKQDHIPESAGEDLDSEKHKADANSIDENGEGTVTPSDPSNRTGQSRSARRKKAKRQWKRLAHMSEKEQLLKKQSLEDDLKQSSEDDLKADLGSNKDQNLDTDNQLPEPDEGSDTEDEVVAVMVRPGHFRFTAPGKEKDVEQNDEAKESFNWSGTINKRKGQKWGRENQSASKWNENRAPYENQSASKWNENSAPCENQSASKWNENSAPCENQLSTKGDDCSSPTEKLSDSIPNDSTTPSKISAAQEAPLENASMDYEKLAPMTMTDSPVEGDILAYRLVELSSSFCPELTEYRVGKVSWFEPESNKIMLVPVPQYPFDLIKSTDDDTSEELPDTSSYNEDGSLEIEFQSLVDVRVVKRGEVSLVPAVQHKANGTPAVQHEANGVQACTAPPEKAESKVPSTPAQSIRNNETGGNNSASAPEPVCSPRPENGAKDAWEEISAALSAKKAELLEDNWSKKRAPWAQRAARRSVLGPTLALIRAQNNHQTK